MILRRLSTAVRKQDWFTVVVETLIVVFGVFIGLQVNNWNEARSERFMGQDYLNGFRADFLADSKMLQTELNARKKQLQEASIVLEFFEGRELEVSTFFEAFYGVLYERSTTPNRNTMDEVLNSGSLRLIRDEGIRTGLLDLYASYVAIESHEEHIARDFDEYLYNPTFSSVPVQIEGPWEDNEKNRAIAETLLANTAVENGFRLIVLNLRHGENQGLIADLEAARVQVESLLQELPQEQ